MWDNRRSAPASTFSITQDRFSVGYQLIGVVNILCRDLDLVLMFGISISNKTFVSDCVISLCLSHFSLNFNQSGAAYAFIVWIVFYICCSTISIIMLCFCKSDYETIVELPIWFSQIVFLFHTWCVCVCVLDVCDNL